MRRTVRAFATLVALQFGLVVLGAAAALGETAEAGRCYIWLQFGQDEVVQRVDCAPGQTVSASVGALSVEFEVREREAWVTLRPINFVFFNEENTQPIGSGVKKVTPFYDTESPDFRSGGLNQSVGQLRFQYQPQRQ